MSVDVVVPDLGESITEALVASWLRADGELVALDEPIVELETDKATVELPSPAAGILRITTPAGQTVAVGERLGAIEEAAGQAQSVAASGGPARNSADAPSARPQQMTADAPVAPSRQPVSPSPQPPTTTATPLTGAGTVLSPAARRLVEEHELDPHAIEASGKGGRVTKADVLSHIDRTEQGQASRSPSTAESVEEPPDARTAAPPSPGLALVRRAAAAAAEETAPQQSRAPAAQPAAAADDEERVPMTPMRRTIAARLVSAQQTAAILTTFNEIDMSSVMALRARHKETFQKTYGVSLGFMSFFARACILACADVPAVNARIEREEIVYSRRVHLGIAASTPKGLVVPVVKRADAMSMADLEKEIGRLAELARSGKLALDDMAGGTFTISNGGVFGSLLSTPILNPPQSGILGMHKIEKRPVVVDDEIVVRPMMYVALSYDHRLVDGREAVTFLVRVKERLEDPDRMLLGI
ncbi:MAG TPA: dihydrolipoyllysine-residue succinyltransferase [Gammaproteobacteria bacterium]